MKKKLLSLLLCITLVIVAECGFTACNDKDDPPPSADGAIMSGGDDEPQDSDDESNSQEIGNELVEELKLSLKAYLETDNFRSSVQSANTSQARLPLLYLRYVQGTFYDTNNVVQFRKYLNYINDVIDDGKIADYKFSTSQIASYGWYGIIDYLYTWSMIYNQYLQWCEETQLKDQAADIYLPIISRYLGYADKWLSDSYSLSVEYKGEKITNPYSTGINIVNNITHSTMGISTHPLEWWQGFLEIVAERTGSEKGHSEFLEAYESAQTMTDSELRSYKTTLVGLWKNLVPCSQVSFGYNVFAVLPLIANNLGFDVKTVTPYCYGYMREYYEKDENGSFVKDGGTPNWVGFSGRPLCGALYRGDVESSTYLAYEKTMQGYFPFTDGWNQPLDEMVNLDRLCNYYNHTLNTGANVTPQYGLLYGMMYGIDMEHYKKEVPLADEGETGDEVFNVITLWRNGLSKDDSGNYVIKGFTDMAVAISYIALNSGIEAPSPLGLYSPNHAVIEL